MKSHLLELAHCDWAAVVCIALACVRKVDVVEVVVVGVALLLTRPTRKQACLIQMIVLNAPASRMLYRLRGQLFGTMRDGIRRQQQKKRETPNLSETPVLRRQHSGSCDSGQLENGAQAAFRQRLGWRGQHWHWGAEFGNDWQSRSSIASAAQLPRAGAILLHFGEIVTISSNHIGLPA